MSYISSRLPFRIEKKRGKKEVGKTTTVCIDIHVYYHKDTISFEYLQKHRER